MYYDPAVVGNGDLDGYVWQLRNLDDSGDGGLLVPTTARPATGTIIHFR